MAGNEEFYKNSRVIFFFGYILPRYERLFTQFLGSFYHVKCLPQILGPWDPIKGRLAMNAMKVGIDQLFSGTFESFLQKKVKGNKKGVEHFRLLCVFVFAVKNNRRYKHLSFIFPFFSKVTSGKNP